MQVKEFVGHLNQMSGDLIVVFTMNRNKLFQCTLEDLRQNSCVYDECKIEQLRWTKSFLEFIFTKDEQGSHIGVEA